jgi:polyvinyl alcohol dehydrogenase (cytochrome)
MGKLALQIAVLLLSLPLPPASRADDPGKAVYEKNCASCHDDRKRERTPDRDSLGNRTRETILEALETGIMSAQGKALGATERSQVATFLSRTHSQPAAANACAKRKWRPTTQDWRGWGAEPTNTRFQKSPGLTATSLAKLKLKWAFGFENTPNASVQPVVFGGRVFVGSFNKKVYSLDAGTGCTYWAFEAAAGVRTAVSIARIGSTRLALFGDLEGFVYAVDAESGKLLWKERVDDHPAAMITGSPLLFENRLYVPVSSGEEWRAQDPSYPCCSFRGSLVALDAATGKRLWKSSVINGPVQETEKDGHKFHGPSGAAIWVAPTLDPKRNLIYVGTGNAYSPPASDTVDSVIALDLKTGEQRWKYQFSADDAWNFACANPKERKNCPDSTAKFQDTDVASPAILATPDLLLASYNLGLFAFDLAHDHKILWRKPIGAFRGFQQIRNGQAVDGKNVYVSVVGGFLPDKTYNSNIGGGVYAIDLKTGDLRWQVQPQECPQGTLCFTGQPTPVTAIRDAIFTGSLDGHLFAQSTRDGRTLWAFDTNRTFDTVNGLKAHGGSLGFAGVAVANGMIFAGSGYDRSDRPYGGNVLLAFAVQDP